MLSNSYTPREVAQARGVGINKVHTWIRSGQLEAVNVSEGNARPRWRITPDALAAFDHKRSSRRAIQPAAPKRRRRDSITEYV